MICSSLNRLLRTTPPPGPGRAILNERSHISSGLISGGQVIRTRWLPGHSLVVYALAPRIVPAGNGCCHFGAFLTVSSCQRRISATRLSYE